MQKKPEIITRYHRALSLVPRLIAVCDICHIYDNTYMPFRIFKRRKDEYFMWENRYWSEDRISELTGIVFGSKGL